MKWWAQSFPQISGLFAIFDRSFAKIVALSGEKIWESVVHLKGQSLRKKTLKQHQSRLINRHTILVQIMSPRTNSAPASERDKLSWCWQQARRVSGQSRSTNIVPFHMLHMVSYYAIVTLSLKRAVLRYSSSKNFMTLKWGSKVTQGHWEWYHSIGCVWFPISVL